MAKLNEAVLDEIDYTKEILNERNTSYTEQLTCPKFNTTSHINILELNQKYKPLYDFNMTLEDNSFAPLKTVILENNGEKIPCEFHRYDLLNIESHHAIRHISYLSNGDIFLRKEKNPRRLQPMPHFTTYNAHFNVLSNEFNLNVCDQHLIQEHPKQYQNNLITIYYDDDILKERFNNIDFIHYLDTNQKQMRIIKMFDDKSPLINFYIELDADNMINRLIFKYYTHFENGSIKYRYDIEINPKKQLTFHVINHNGNVTDAYKTKSIIKTFNENVNFDNVNTEDVIMAYFIHEIEDHILSSSTSKPTILNRQFDTSIITNIELYLIDFLKQFKREVPLKGLEVRINNLLNTVTPNGEKKRI